MNLIKYILAFLESLFTHNTISENQEQDGADVQQDSVVVSVPVPVLESDKATQTKTRNNPYCWIIDCGHGRETKGKKSPWFLLDGRQVRFEEWEFNRDIGLRISVELERLGIDFKFTVEPDDDRDLSLFQRVKIANEYHSEKPKIFLSIHANAGLARSSQHWQLAHGVEVWHYNKSEKGQEIASHFQREIVTATEWRNRGLKSKTEKQFYVLKKTNFPAVLTESGFYNHLEQCFELMQSETRQTISDAHVNAILAIK